MNTKEYLTEELLKEYTVTRGRGICGRKRNSRLEVLLDAGYYTTAEIGEIMGMTELYVEEAQAAIAAVRHKY